MAIGKGEKKTRWEDVVAGFKVQQPKKTSSKASGSGASASKDKEAEKNGGGAEGAAGTGTTKE